MTVELLVTVDDLEPDADKQALADKVWKTVQEYLKYNGVTVEVVQ